jgi:predicted transcriptional regulator of viral defense system
MCLTISLSKLQKRWKTLKVDQWLNFFKNNKKKKLFSLSDLTQLTGEDKSSLSVQLTRLIKTNVISRIATTRYENPFAPPSNEECAMVIRFPSYLSLEYALSKHGVLSQMVHTLTLVTTKLPYTYKTQKAVYEYHQMKKSLFWGYKKEKTVLTAEPEKALLDLIYIRLICNKEMTQEDLASLVNDMDLSEFDKKRLYRYAEKFSLKTKFVLQSLGIQKKL